MTIETKNCRDCVKVERCVAIAKADTGEDDRIGFMNFRLFCLGNGKKYFESRYGWLPDNDSV